MTKYIIRIAGDEDSYIELTDDQQRLLIFLKDNYFLNRDCLLFEVDDTFFEKCKGIPFTLFLSGLPV